MVTRALLTDGRLLSLVVVLLCATACGKDSPTGPSTPPTTETRIIAISGTLDFNDVEVGSSADRFLTVRNEGTASLSLTGITLANASAFSVSWTTATIAPGGSQSLGVRFEPTAVRSYDTTLRFLGNQTAGDNTRAVFASGVRTGPLWTRSGAGNTVFDMPTYIPRVRIKGRWNRTQLSNFIVNIGGRNVVNEILRNSITYDGVHLTNGGDVVEIESSAQIAWEFIEER